MELLRGYKTWSQKLDVLCSGKIVIEFLLPIWLFLVRDLPSFHSLAGKCRVLHTQEHIRFSKCRWHTWIYLITRRKGFENVSHSKRLPMETQTLQELHCYLELSTHLSICTYNWEISTATLKIGRSDLAGWTYRNFNSAAKPVVHSEKTLKKSLWMETHRKFLSFKQVFPVQGIAWPVTTTLSFSLSHTHRGHKYCWNVSLCSHSLSCRMHLHIVPLLISTQNISLNKEFKCVF